MARVAGARESVRVAMSMFGKKKKGDDAPEDAGASERENLGADPAKARRFFEHARAMQDSANYEYAMTLWLQGLQRDPQNMEALEAFFESAANFLVKNPKAKGPTKDQLGQFKKKGPLEKYAVHLLHWATRPAVDWQSGMRAMEEAARLELDEPGYWIGERVHGLARQDPKAKKDQFVTLMGLFEKVGGYDKAVSAGEDALKLDPRDGKLEARVRNLSATATMSKGGYADTGKAGGFRANIRDLEGQTAREEDEALVKTGSALDRTIERAADAYKSDPLDQNAAQKLGKLLLERGKPDDEKAAIKVYLKAHEDTQSYRFKQLAGDVKMRIARRKFRAIRDGAASGDGEAKARLDKARRQLLEFERDEFAERVDNYPTDLALKFELGVRQFQLGEHEGAIEQFQVAQGAAGKAAIALSYLGRSFEALGWLDEAEDTFRRAVEAHQPDGDDLALELRYGLMSTLQRKAAENRDADAANEAFRLASGIAIKQINYKDIRERRTTLQELVKELRG